MVSGILWGSSIRGTPMSHLTDMWDFWKYAECEPVVSYMHCTYHLSLFASLLTVLVSLDHKFISNLVKSLKFFLCRFCSL